VDAPQCVIKALLRHAGSFLTRFEAHHRLSRQRIGEQNNESDEHHGDSED
jgi:hypothetical protein